LDLGVENGEKGRDIAASAGVGVEALSGPRVGNGEGAGAAAAPFDHIQFFKDMKQVWKNAQRFNTDNSPIWVAAEQFKHHLQLIYKDRMLDVISGKVPPPAEGSMEEFLASRSPWDYELEEQQQERQKRGRRRRQQASINHGSMASVKGGKAGVATR
ncbi:unnamed protein product, partial [Discosporangium mesarthrocarpum]